MARLELESFAAQILDVLPAVLFLVDCDVRIRYANSFGESLIGGYFSESVNGTFGDAVKCAQSFEGPSGCGSGPACKYCRIRNSIYTVFAEKKKIREENEILTSEGKKISIMLNASPVRVNGEELAMLYLEDLREIKQLQDLLPICMKCHKVRNSDTYWQNVESYLREHAGVSVSHGLCDDCLERYYPTQKKSN